MYTYFALLLHCNILLNNINYSFLWWTFSVFLAWGCYNFYEDFSTYFWQNFVLISLRDILAVVQSLIHLWLFVTAWTAACQASVSFTISQSLLKFMFIESLMLSNHLIPCRPFFFCLQFFPASDSFSMSRLFASSGQIIGASASVLPMNIKDWFPLGWTGWISLQSKGLSRVFSNTTVKKHQFFCAQLSL